MERVFLDGKLYVSAAWISPGELTVSPRERSQMLSLKARGLLCDLLDVVWPDGGDWAFAKEASGRPIPEKGLWWTVSHKPSCIMVAVARRACGVDVEAFRPLSQNIWSKIATEFEQDLCRPMGNNGVFWCFALKEAALKSTGQGLSGLSGCQLIQSNGMGEWLLRTDSGLVTVTAWEQRGHIFAVTDQVRNLCWVKTGGLVPNIPGVQQYNESLLP